MKNLLISSLFFFVSLNAFATSAPVGTLGTIPSATICGRVFTDLTNLITLGCQNTSTNKSTCRKQSGTAGYTPSGGLAFKAKAMVGWETTTGASVSISFGYADTDTGMNTGTALVNPIYQIGNSVGSFFVGAAASGGVISNNCAIIDFTVPNAKYMFLDSANSGVLVYGYEQ